MLDLKQVKIGVIGLGYVGLPLAVAFSKQFPTDGFDADPERIEQLDQGFDRHTELDNKTLTSASRLRLHHDETALADCNVYIIAVPTPINEHKWPDLKPLRDASRIVGRLLKQNDIVIYESTVYPGATEEVCIPILEQTSGLSVNVDFYVGYSPERINPADQEHTLQTIRKLVSGSTPEVADFVAGLYREIVAAGVYKTESIRIAEAAKVIENVQRDVNIALVNELAQIFQRLGIDTEQVLEAAETKWNFLPFRPGLVGGHCIGVDPYYLTHKAMAAGYQPTVIPASRLVNEGMGEHVANRTLRLMAQQGIEIVDARILVMGLAFKENCPDLRNTKVIDIIDTLRKYSARVDILDPVVDAVHARSDYGIELLSAAEPGSYDAIVIAVAHDTFKAMGADEIRKLGKTNCIIYDVKSILPKHMVHERL